MYMWIIDKKELMYTCMNKILNIEVKKIDEIILLCFIFIINIFLQYVK